MKLCTHTDLTNDKESCLWKRAVRNKRERNIGITENVEKAIVMKDYFELKLDKIPKGSRLERYLEELPKVMAEYETFLSYLKDLFMECLKSATQNTGIVSPRKIILTFAHTHEQYETEEKKEAARTVSKENAKLPSHAFVITSNFEARVCIDFEFFVDLLKDYGYPTFILNITQTYLHEILHIMFPQKYEQEIYDLQCSLLESFLGIKLPEEKKKLKASDYYSKVKPS